MENLAGRNYLRKSSRKPYPVHAPANAPDHFEQYDEIDVGLRLACEALQDIMLLWKSEGDDKRGADYKTPPTAIFRTLWRRSRRSEGRWSPYPTFIICETALHC
jgi:hypothetical protein